MFHHPCSVNTFVYCSDLCYYNYYELRSEKSTTIATFEIIANTETDCATHCEADRNCMGFLWQQSDPGFKCAKVTDISDSNIVTSSNTDMYIRIPCDLEGNNRGTEELPLLTVIYIMISILLSLKTRRINFIYHCNYLVNHVILIAIHGLLHRIGTYCHG